MHVHMGFVVHKVALRRVCLLVLQFFLVSVVPSVCVENLVTF